jgi:hypothetical protein
MAGTLRFAHPAKLFYSSLRVLFTGQSGNTNLLHIKAQPNNLTS